MHVRDRVKAEKAAAALACKPQRVRVLLRRGSGCKCLAYRLVGLDRP
ncbi:hypothetical protein NZJ93_09570 [Desulfofundulus thermocisternus]|nr:hypothetical protein [Desulfofundulus thermocisternus]